jgi:hypothetical protein
MTDLTSSRRDCTAALGMRVTLELKSSSGIERMELEIVPDQFADIRLGYLGVGTLLAKSILGHKAGDTFASLADDAEEIRLLNVVPSHQPPNQKIAERREQVLRKAVDQSDHTNAVIFASSFSGKWGDYDPNSIGDAPDAEEKEQPEK